MSNRSEGDLVQRNRETEPPVLVDPDPTLPANWGPYREIDETLDKLACLVLSRWRPRNAEAHEPPLPKELKDALLDLRPLVREACGVWRRLGRYAREEVVQ